METFELNNGNFLPAIGLGTFPMKHEIVKKAVAHLVENRKTDRGVVLLDTARDYGNESDLGIVLHDYLGKSKRENLFITTKIGNSQQMNYAKGGFIEADIECSLQNLRLEYVDMLLMHWPFPELYEKTWKLMEQIYKKGLVKNIGVCNFKIRHLERLLKVADVIPVVNQIELHPLRTAETDVAYCKKNGILVQAYCPLGLMDDSLKNSVILKTLASKYHKDIAQIILRWDFQNGIASVPKSSTLERIDSNFNIFDFCLSETEMEAIHLLNRDYKFYCESFYCPGY